MAEGNAKNNKNKENRNRDNQPKFQGSRNKKNKKNRPRSHQKVSVVPEQDLIPESAAPAFAERKPQRTRTFSSAAEEGTPICPEDELIPPVRTEAAEETLQAEETATVVTLVFRNGGKAYYFDPAGFVFEKGDHVLVETARGKEIGTVRQANHEVPLNKVVPPLKPVLGPATAEDLTVWERNRKAEADALVIFRDKVRKHNMNMNPVAVEYALDGNKILFYFTAETRVDFRELVKDLASVFRTRIELRQIGIRDETKMMGGFGTCGRPFCCSTFLSDFAQVSIKMAKEQNFSLNSAKISGTCGRLMCCLRYEHEVYEEAQKTTPSTGAQVMTEAGPGVVTESRPLSGTVKVRLFDDKEQPRLFRSEEVRVIPKNRPQNQDEKQQNVRNTEDSTETETEL